MFEIDSSIASPKSIISILHPSTKVACAFLFSFSVAAIYSFDGSLLAFCFGVFFSILGKLNIKYVLKRLFYVNFFILFLWLIIPFSKHGEVVFTLFGHAASYEGIEFAAVVTLKSNAIILVMMSFISTMKPHLLGVGLQGLRCPDKLCRIFLFAWRYVHLIFEEYKVMIRAAKLRSFKASNSLRTYKTYAWIVGMLLVRSLDRSERIWKAMICRGFDGKFRSLQTYKYSLVDIFGGLGMLLCIASIFWVEFYRGVF